VCVCVCVCVCVFACARTRMCVATLYMHLICMYLKASSFGCARAYMRAMHRTHARSVRYRILWTSRCTCNTSRRRKPAIAMTTRNQRLRHLRMRHAFVRACVRTCMPTSVFVTVRFIVLRMSPSTSAVSYTGCSKNASMDFSTNGVFLF